MPTGRTSAEGKNSGILAPLSIGWLVLVLGKNKLNRLIGATVVFCLYTSLVFQGSDELLEFIADSFFQGGPDTLSISFFGLFTEP